MIRKKAGFAVVISLALGLLISIFWDSQEERGAVEEPLNVHSETPLADSDASVDGSQPIGLSEVQDEPVNETVTFNAPTGRYAKSKVLDRLDPYVDGDNTVVRFLVEGPDNVIQKVLVEERYIEDPDTEEMLLWRDTAIVGDEIMIDAAPGLVDADKFDQFISERGLGIVKKSKLSHYLSLKLSEATIRGFDQLLNSLRKDFPDTVVSEDHLYYINATPDDYNAPLMWNLDQIGASDAWRFDTGSSDVIVGVVDTGVLYDHPDLAENIWRNPLETPDNGVDDDGNGFIDDVVGWDFYSDDSDPEDDHGHGTHISGTIGAVGNNSLGTVGLNWNVKIVPLRVGTQDSLSSSAIAEGLRYLRSIKERGENVIASNNSYGSGSKNIVAEAEIKNHRDEGILFVAAAGNDGDDLDSAGNAQYPAQINSSNVVAVANSSQEDTLSDNSNYGSNSVHLAAPGKEIYSTYVGGSQYAILSGTSMSAPLVVGAAALLKSYRPTMSANAIKTRLLDTVDVAPGLIGNVISGGRLNIRNALQPDLLGFEASVSNHTGAIVFLPEAGMSTEFEIDTALGATVTASLIEPDSGAIIEPLEDGRSFKVSCSEEGSYLIRFVADLLGVDIEIDRLVVVGSPDDVENGLKHEWAFEGEGDGFVDTVGSSDANVINVERVSSPMGKAADFAGANSKATFNTAFYPRVTISGFVRNENLTSSSHPRITQGPSYYIYFSTGNIGDGNSETFKFLSVRSGGLGVWNTNPRTAVANKWMHVMASYDTRDVNNVPDMYINGVKQRVRAQSFPVGDQDQSASTSYIGDREDGLRAWDGQFDEVRIYDAPLDEYEAMVLTSRYLYSLWSEVEITGSGETSLGNVEHFSRGFSYDGENEFDFRWMVSGPSDDSFVIESQSSEDIEVSFLEKGTYSIELEIVAPESTFTIRKIVDVVTEVTSGVFVADVGNGGHVWLEISPSLADGFATYFSPNSDERILREPISIDLSGNFETGESSSLSISGLLDVPITGRIEELNIDFVTDSLIPVSSESDFAGVYKGGGVGVPDEHFKIAVFQSGSALLLRDGAYSDSTHGSVQSNGSFEFTSESGAFYSGNIDLEVGRISGDVTGDENFELYLHNGEGEKNARFINLSTRGVVGEGDNVLIGGFVLRGEPRPILVRAVGPSLSEFDVPNFLSEPRLNIYQGSSLIASSGPWGDQPNADDIRAVTQSLYAYPFPDGSNDAAVLKELGGGLYTAMALGGESGPGTVLLEIYDSVNQTVSQLANVSSRGRIDGSTDVMIAGFVVRGSEPKKVLLRVVGPGLSDVLPGYLEDPFISLYRGQNFMTSNDDWSEPVAGENGDRAVGITEAEQSVNAPSLVKGSKDSALVIWLKPGSYTMIVTGVDGSSGIALAEVYEIR